RWSRFVLFCMMKLHEIKCSSASGRIHNPALGTAANVAFEPKRDGNQPTLQMVLVVMAMIFQKPEGVGRQRQVGLEQWQQGGNNSLSGSFDNVDRAQQANRVGGVGQAMQIGIQCLTARITA